MPAPGRRYGGGCLVAILARTAIGWSVDEGRGVALVRPVALHLPGAVEEDAWLGVRWRIRGRTFAHVLVVQDGRPPAYARALAHASKCVLALRSSAAELAALEQAGPPFYPVASRDRVVLLDLEGEVDQDELRELLTESWRLLAPARLAAQHSGVKPGPPLDEQGRLRGPGPTP
jgi:predicted DNA-binding protein (MmcQ/YjbR family)